MKTNLPAELPVVGIVSPDGAGFNVAVTFNGVMTITGVSSADYRTAQWGAAAVAEGIYAVIDAYPICAYPATEAEWQQARSEAITGQVQYATEPSEYWSEQ